MTAQVIRLYDHSVRATPRKYPGAVELVIQRQERARLQRNAAFNATVAIGRARTELGLCAQCERPIGKQQMIYAVPAYGLGFCIPCGVRWRDEIYPLLRKG